MTGIDILLETAVTTGAVPNIVVVVADGDGIGYQGAAGLRVAAGDEPVDLDTPYAVMSMTKIVTTIAALQLVERDRLDSDAPVQAYRPEFTAIGVLDRFDGDTPQIRPPAREATVQHLLTHTSGLRRTAARLRAGPSGACDGPVRCHPSSLSPPDRGPAGRASKHGARPPVGGIPGASRESADVPGG